MKYIDVNVIYYFLTADPIFGKRSKEIIRENEDLATSSLTVWLLYVLTKLEDLIEVLEDLGIEVLDLNKRILKVSKRLMKRYNLDFEDAIHVATMLENEIPIIFSNDSDFDKVNIIRRIF